MSEEVLELLKTQIDCDNSTKLLTLTNIKLLSSHMTELIVKNIDDKHKLNTYIGFIRNLIGGHKRKQCVNSKNVSIYLKHLPISSKNLEEEELFLQKSDFKDELNSFYALQHQRRNALYKRKAFINAQIQQSLPPDFECTVLMNEVNSLPFQLSRYNEVTQQNVDVIDNEHQRESLIKLAVSVINLDLMKITTSGGQITLNNVIQKLLKYDVLLTCEREFLRLLLSTKMINVPSLLQKFPFLLEESVIDIAMKHLQGTLANKDFKLVDSLMHDREIKCQVMKIVQSLFVLSKWDCKLLEVFTKRL